MAETLVYVAPEFQQVPLNTLLDQSGAIDAVNSKLATLQQQVTDQQVQITDLETRVAALENPPAP